MNPNTTRPTQEQFSPRNFLRARRPERFSDSKVRSQSRLDRSFLEYQLDTITSRSQEVAFEDFARQLLQKEVCPNLLPHTGPTGGGDSKVDSETYPVADAISAAWFTGFGDTAARERWAVAISAKKKWKEKVQHDVEGIVGTGNDFKKIFVSSRFIKDKDRAEVERALSDKSGCDVRIFDRTWILDRVLTNHHEELAIKALRLTVSIEDTKDTGPLDLERDRDLIDAEQRIKDGLAGTPSLALVDDCLEAALLARGLELPRVEVDGRFVRAQRVAKDHGTDHQKVLAYYEHAWTTFWRYEDLAAFEAQYADVERLAVRTDNIADAELLSNLWMVLHSSTRHDAAWLQKADVERRTRELADTLGRLAAQDDRPSVSLQARSLIAVMELSQSAPQVPEKPLRDLQAIVEESKGLIGFPLLHLSELLAELTEHLIDSPAFAQLFETVADITAKRRGEVAKATLLLEKGKAELRAKRPYEAIRTTGRIFAELYKEESRGKLMSALFLCARAYESVGLLWAARGALLLAASLAADEWWKHSTIHPALERAIRRLKWVELQLGRIPQVLAWHDVDIALQEALVLEGYSREQVTSHESDFDGILAILLLRADMWQLKELRRLPDSLMKLRLGTSTLALMFALGHEEPFDARGETVSTDDQRRLFLQLSEQPAARDLSDVALAGLSTNGRPRQQGPWLQH